MLQVVTYSSSNLPPDLKKQIISFLNQEWPDRTLKDRNQKDFVAIRSYNPTHFVLVDEDKVIGYVAVPWKMLEHKGIYYKTYGLSGVFTKPEFRNKGNGLKIIKEAKKYIESTDADIALFSSVLKNFYEKAGFILLPNAKLLKGNPQNPVPVNEDVFMLFVSDKGRKARKDFETTLIYFGEDTW